MSKAPTVDEAAFHPTDRDQTAAAIAFWEGIERSLPVWPTPPLPAKLKMRWPPLFRRETPPPPPAMPETAPPVRLPRWEVSRDPQRLYAIGDIHGELDKFVALRDAILRDCETVPGVKLLVLLGDYIDRGPASAQVLELLLQPLPPQVLQVCLRGNHEQMLLDVLERRAQAGRWLSVGGAQTVQSYGLDPNAAGMAGRSARELTDDFVEGFPPRHREFLERLPASFGTPNHLFVHAGVMPGRPFAEQTDRDLLWTHGSLMENAALLADRRVVHGHTPYSRPLLTPHRIAIDTGACRGGPLTAVRIVGNEVDFLQSS